MTIAEQEFYANVKRMASKVDNIAERYTKQRKIKTFEVGSSVATIEKTEVFCKDVNVLQIKTMSFGGSEYIVVLYTDK